MHEGVILIELNEVNFDYVGRYCSQGKLPALAKLITQHGVIETRSESRYEEIEPWIQWVTAHTGKTYAEHGIFRLGDVIDRQVVQIWEVLEAAGKKVGAISPMNAVNRCTNPAFFVPDPWTPGTVIGSVLLRKLHAAIAQTVNDNAEARMSPESIFWLSVGVARFARVRHYRYYARMLRNALRGRSWSKALLLDLLLADAYLRLLDANNPDFSSLFLNAAAHIQHHYMFNSHVYEGDRSNPAWYIDPDADPVFEAYDLYDRIIAEVQRCHPRKRLMLATGLHQDPHPKTTYYWRLSDHAGFLQRQGIDFSSIEPRMSRDFVVRCTTETEARLAEQTLSTMVSDDGTALFEIDNRGCDLFVMLVWAREIDNDFMFFANGRPRHGFRSEVTFVAIKNGHHNGTGYLIDSRRSRQVKAQIPLSQMPTLICDSFGLNWDILNS